jgi:hypothetical protein
MTEKLSNETQSVLPQSDSTELPIGQLDPVPCDEQERYNRSYIETNPPIIKKDGSEGFIYIKSPSERAQEIIEALTYLGLVVEFEESDGTINRSDWGALSKQEKLGMYKEKTGERRIAIEQLLQKGNFSAISNYLYTNLFLLNGNRNLEAENILKELNKNESKISKVEKELAEISLLEIFGFRVLELIGEIEKGHDKELKDSLEQLVRDRGSYQNNHINKRVDVRRIVILIRELVFINNQLQDSKLRRIVGRHIKDLNRNNKANEKKTCFFLYVCNEAFLFFLMKKQKLKYFSLH